MQVMKELWDKAGYADLNLTSKNLRDQAASLEKTLRNVRETIVRSVRRIREQTGDITESEDSSNETRPTLETNLHTTTASQTPEDHTVTHIEGDTGLRHHLRRA